jgi:hypothetical protein
MDVGPEWTFTCIVWFVCEIFIKSDLNYNIENVAFKCCSVYTSFTVITMYRLTLLLDQNTPWALYLMLIERENALFTWLSVTILYEYWIEPTGWPLTPKTYSACTKLTNYMFGNISYLPITVTARSKAWTVFACSNTGFVGSYITWGMDVCVRLFCV